MYDIIFSLGGHLDKINPGKEISEKFTRWIKKQYRGIPLEHDPEIL